MINRLHSLPIALPGGEPEPSFAAARNACKMCTPLGACLAFTGVEGCVPFLHGSQGCATYIRRYLISHFREPMDIASSNFGEQAAIFGGAQNLSTGLMNVIRGYRPAVIGIATTCLSETIGDDLRRLLMEFRKARGTDANLPHLVHTSTPSFKGSHADGYVSAVRSIVDAIACKNEPSDAHLVNIIPGMVSPADLRHLREIVEAFGLSPIILPDYSERLDGPSWSEYQEIPAGGTRIADIQRMGSAAATIELTSADSGTKTAGSLLAERFGVKLIRMQLPIGIAASDAFFAALEQLSGRPTPAQFAAERGRLVDSYVDAHKYIFEKRAVIYGEADLVVALAGLCGEIGVTQVICATGGRTGTLAKPLAEMLGQRLASCRVMEDVDFEDIADAANEVSPDLLIGNSKGYKLARRLAVPLVRVGLPIHDRVGGARLLHLGYRGTQQLFDLIVNALLQQMQDSNDVGYTYI